MVQAIRNPLVSVNGTRLKSAASHKAMAPAAVEAARKGLLKGEDEHAAKRAKLMLVAKMSVYVSLEIPQGGGFVVIDPETLDPMKRALCPFKVKTLCIHPEDIDQAIDHFEKAAADA